MAQKLNPQQNSLYGSPVPLSNQNPPPIKALRDPTTADIGYPIGQSWVNSSTGFIYFLTQVSGGQANWSLATSGTGDVAFLDGDSGQAEPLNGVITLAGGDNITTTAATNTVTIDLDDPVQVNEVIADTFSTENAATGMHMTDSNLIADGTDANIGISVIPKGTGGFTVSSGALVVNSGDVNVVNGNLSLSGNAAHIEITGGSATDFAGSATLVGGTVTVSNTNIATGDLIIYNRSTTGGTAGHLSYTINDGTSFTFNSSSGSDTSTIAYVIFRPI